MSHLIDSRTLLSRMEVANVWIIVIVATIEGISYGLIVGIVSAMGKKHISPYDVRLSYSPFF